MFSPRIADALNRQMNNEFESRSILYGDCEHNSYGGFAHFYLQQAEEERFHGMKIYQYLNNRGVHAEFTGVSEPKIVFNSIFEYLRIGIATREISN